MEKKWLKGAYCAPGYFGDCKNPKKLLEKCFTNPFPTPKGTQQEKGGPGEGDPIFNFGIEPLLAAAAKR
uniref:ORF2 n=1 Tax=Torque teno sus virus 1b TaxID=687387 RepID=S4T6P3_9VIRU|nr:ORF2 [Torque teno sus virus 1b]